MYAIVETGGKQYRVKPGEVLDVELLEGEEGENIRLDKVLMVAYDNGVSFGDPLLDGAFVEATIEEHAKAKKVLVFKYKSKKNYRRLKGHRQHYTRIKINSINQ